MYVRKTESATRNQSTPHQAQKEHARTGGLEILLRLTAIRWGFSILLVGTVLFGNKLVHQDETNIDDAKIRFLLLKYRQ